MKQKKLYKEMIQKDIDALTREKSNRIKKHNILDILNNVGEILGNIYFHYKDVSKETEYERSVAERAKLRRQRLDKVKKREKNINNNFFSHYFNYSSPKNLCGRLGDAKGEINNDEVYLIKEELTKIQNTVKNVPKDKTFKIEENEKIIDIVERILERNNENQLGECLKILTPSQMLSRIATSLAQLKAGNNCEKLKKKLGNYCILCTDQKDLQKNLIKV